MELTVTSRLTNRFEGYRRLQAVYSKRDADLIELFQSHSIAGSVFHLLREIPEQGEDLYTVLCDDQLVVSFEVPRGKLPLSAEKITEVPIAQYRRQLGQGKNLMRLDQTLRDARTLLGE